MNSESERLLAANLPVHLTPFIGRERELVQVRRLMTTTRLLTLTGPGGCGKTRLAVEVAREVADTFTDGVWWVDLVGVVDPELVPQAVAQALELPEAPNQSLLETLLDYLRSRQLLLVLDNCEHLVLACAQLAHIFLGACPHLRILATSREALNITGETPWLVPSLSLPRPGDKPVLDELAHYDAIHLFVERATTILPAFALTESNREAVVQVCRRLDGIPLAIELAAARVRLLKVEQIAARLSDTFRLLTMGSPVVLPRHQTLRAAIDWSYNLLLEPEKLLFRRLSLFAGGFTLEAVETICAGEGIDAADILDLLTQLLNKSLVTAEREQGQEARFRLLETISHYAHEKLHEAGEVEPWRIRHLDFFRQLAESAERWLRSSREVSWLDRLEVEHDNLQAALSGSLASQETNVESGLRLFAALAEFWLIRNLVTAGRHNLERALAKVHLASTPVQAKVFLKAALLLRDLGDYNQARQLFQDSLALYREMGDKRGIAWTLREFGMAYFNQSRFEQAFSLFAESLALSREVDDKVLMAALYSPLGYITLRHGDLDKAKEMCEEGLAVARQADSQRDVLLLLHQLGIMALKRGEQEQAVTLLNESLAVARELKDTPNVVRELLTLGDLATIGQNYEQAGRCYQESLALARQLANKQFIATALHRTAQVMLQQGNRQQATKLLKESIALSHEIGQRDMVNACLIEFAGVAAGQPERATRLLAAAETVRETIGVSLYIAIQIGYDRNLALARAQLNEAAFAVAWAEGRAMTVEQAIAYALEKGEGRGMKDELHPSAFIPQPSVELRLYALGRSQVYRGERLLAPADWTFARPKALLFYLLCHPTRTKEQIGLDFWPDASPAQLRSSLRAALYHLRRALGRQEWIVFEDGRYTFNHSLAYWFDVEAFESNLAQVHQRPAAEAVPYLEEAVKLYQGDFLEDFSDDDWCRPRREALRRQYVEALLGLGQLYFAAGRYAEAAGVYRRLIDQDNLLEAAHRGLMRCYARQGERSQALRHYQSLARLLADEVGSPPEPRTAALFQRLRQGEAV